MVCQMQRKQELILLRALLMDHHLFRITIPQLAQGQL